MRLLVGLGFALATATPLVAAEAADEAPQAVRAPQDQAIGLARLMSPRDLLVDMEVREFDKHFVSSLRADPELKSMEDEYPGLFEAMHKASRGLVSQSMSRTVEQIHLSIAKLIEATFTPADIAELSDFYRSPVGQKTIRQMAASADAGKLYSQAVEQREFKLTEEQIAAQVQDNARKAVQTFTPDEQTEMMLFMAKPSFGKLARAQPQIQKILADEFNAPDPEFDRQVEQAMGAAIEQHIASFDKNGGK